MINVIYVGDHLIAYKVTGNHNILCGEVTFTANLSPPDSTSNGKDNNGPPAPIILLQASAKEMGYQAVRLFFSTSHNHYLVSTTASPHLHIFLFSHP